MPSQRPIPPSEWSDKELESYTFGPYSATQLAGANTHFLLPIDFPKDAVIHDVRVKATTRSTATDFTLALTKGTINATTKVVTAPSGALTATTSSSSLGNQVCASRIFTSGTITGGGTGALDNRLEWLPVQKGYTNKAATTFNSQVQPGDPIADTTTGVWENVIEKGNNLYLYGSVAATALAGLYVTIRVGERRTDNASFR